MAPKKLPNILACSALSSWATPAVASALTAKKTIIQKRACILHNQAMSFVNERTGVVQLHIGLHLHEESDGVITMMA